MEDPCVKIDNWNSRINIFRHVKYCRYAVLMVCMASLVMWGIFGFDSGIGIISTILTKFPSLLMSQISYGTLMQEAYLGYGVSGHFSTIAIYTALFIGMSFAFEKLRITGSKNMFLSLLFLFVQLGFFEHWYRLSVGIFHSWAYCMQGYIQDPIFTFDFVMFFPVTIYGSLFFYANSFEDDGARIYKLKPTRLMWGSIIALIAGILAWYFYPLPFVHVGGSFFPQTVYPFPTLDYYVPNDGVHFMNVLVKGLFALVQYVVLASFKLVKKT